MSPFLIFIGKLFCYGALKIGSWWNNYRSCNDPREECNIGFCLLHIDGTLYLISTKTWDGTRNFWFLKCLSTNGIRFSRTSLPYCTMKNFSIGLVAHSGNDLCHDTLFDAFRNDQFWSQCCSLNKTWYTFQTKDEEFVRHHYGKCNVCYQHFDEPR